MNIRESYCEASGDDNYPAVDDGDHEGSAHVRDEFVHTLVQKAGMHMDVRSLERYLVYLNGKYWGVYTIREKPDDHDYTEYTYKQDKYDLQFLKTWGQTWVEYGDEKALTDWIKFRRYVMENDVSKTEVYNKINNELDVTSLMDYMIANLTCVSSDWLNYNTGWWRGLNNSGKHDKKSGDILCGTMMPHLTIIPIIPVFLIFHQMQKLVTLKKSVTIWTSSSFWILR